MKRVWTLRPVTDAGGEADRLDAVGLTILLAVVMVLLIACTNISPVDPMTVALVPVPFVIAALIACSVPASRASRVELTVALKDL